LKRYTVPPDNSGGVDRKATLPAVDRRLGNPCFVVGTTAPARSTLGAMPGSGRGRLECSSGAFDDRGHMHGRPHRAFEQRPAPRRRPGANHNVGVGLERAAERLRGHLADKMRSLV
jgi:hypothetical protein